MHRKITIVSIVLTIGALVLAFQSAVVFPWFHVVPIGLFVFAGMTGLVPLYQKRRILRAMVGTFLVFAGAFFLYICLRVAVPREGHQEYISPEGARTIVIEYDHASRPSLYLKYGFFMKSVETPEFLGSMAVLRYSIQWLSEDSIILKEEPAGNPVTIQLD